MVFSDSVTNLGIVQQIRGFTRTDSNQWPTDKIVNSVNNYHDLVTGYAIGADRRFQWDDTNYTILPEGTTPLVLNQTDYSFLTDSQGNAILVLLDVTLVDSSTNLETPLLAVDRNSPTYNKTDYGKLSGTPSQYDKIADNIVRLNTKPSASDASRYTLKFYFQRVGSRFTASDTTKSPGVSPLLHRGYVIAGVYDCMLTLKPEKAAVWSTEFIKERDKMIEYFANRTPDEPKQVIGVRRSSR